MELAQIKDVLRTQPFRAFTMRLVDGREYTVPHPEFLYVPPSMKHTVMYSNDETGSVTILDTIMIASIVYPEDGRFGQAGVNGNGNGNGHGGGNGTSGH